MKKLSLFMAALMVSAMAMAADAIVTSTFTSKEWKVGTGEQEWVAAGAAATACESSGSARGVQVGLKNIQTDGLSLTNDSISKMGKGIKKVEVVYSTNKTTSITASASVMVGTTPLGETVSLEKINNATISFASATPIQGDIVISFAATATEKSLYVKSISVTYEKNATSDPSISASELKFGTYVIGKSAAKELVVEGENLTDAITYSWENGGIFSATGSLTATGGTLAIDVIATTDMEAVDSLVLTSGATVKKVAVKANVITVVGDGTKDNPFTVADVKKLGNPGTKGMWVTGTIVGAYVSNKPVAGVPESTKSNMALATGTDTIPVALPSGEIQTALNLVDNPTYLGRTVKVKGELVAYFSTTGVKNTSEYELGAATKMDALLENKSAAKKMMLNGQMVIIRDGKMFNALGAEL